MIPEQIKIKDQWVAALRSGEYGQTINQLHFEGGFCCLGVLCELAVKAGVIPKRNDDDEYDGESFALPESVRRWSGLYEEGGASMMPIHQDIEDCVTLSDLNDYEDFTFAQIADVIDYAPDVFFRSDEQ